MNTRKPGPGEGFGATRRRAGGGEMSEDDVEGHAHVRGPGIDGQAPRGVARDPDARGALPRGPEKTGDPAGQIDDVEGHGRTRGPDPDGNIARR
jgi:hypothetical protein